MKKLSLTIGHLYPGLMNTYGDDGNIIALKKRCEWRGIEAKVKNIGIGDKIKPGDIDLYFFGGGQDQGQIEVSKDLKTGSKHQVLRKDIDRGVPLLSICGGYQLLGEYYQPHKGAKLEGVGIFPVYTKASFDRMIGNIVIQVDSLQLTESSKGQLVGFENHSGKTYLKDGATSLGRVITGFGNNGEDKFEGCIYKNAIGCYMHGSLLPKNPELADWLIKKALEVKYGERIELKPLDDSIENAAHSTLIDRFS